MCLFFSRFLLPCPLRVWNKKLPCCDCNHYTNSQQESPVFNSTSRPRSFSLEFGCVQPSAKVFWCWTHPNSWLSLLQGYLFSNLPLPIEEPVSAILSFQGQILSSITPFKTSELRCAHNFSLTFATITKPSLLDTVIRDRAPTRWLLPIRHCHLLWG